MVALCLSPIQRNTTILLTRAKKDSASFTVTPALYRFIVWIYLSDIKSKMEKKSKLEKKERERDIKYIKLKNEVKE